MIVNRPIACYYYSEHYCVIKPREESGHYMIMEWQSPLESNNGVFSPKRPPNGNLLGEYCPLHKLTKNIGILLTRKTILEE